MLAILSKNEIQAWDKYTIENEPISSIDLMERAAMTFCFWYESQFEKSRPVSIFAGNGNNGGDALAIGSLLLQKGYQIRAFVVADKTLGSPDFLINLNRFQWQHPNLIWFFDSLESETIEIATGEILIDGIYGIGFRKPMPKSMCKWVDWINSKENLTISIDMPSGILCDGEPCDVAIQADICFSFECIKPAFLYAETAPAVGRWIISSIGLHPNFLNSINPPRMFDIQSAHNIYKPRSEFSYKNQYGHVLIVAGSKKMPGAGILVFEACLRSGCGLLTIVSELENRDLYILARPELMFADKLPSTLTSFKVIGVGPGLGIENRALLFDIIPKIENQSLVIDADGLNVLAENSGLLQQLNKNTIITPHVGEFDRLFGASHHSNERQHLATKKAIELQIYIILKGRYTSLHCPDGSVYFNSSGNAALAKGGSGDILTGILCSMLAQNYSIKEACLLACFLHGKVADNLALQLPKEVILPKNIVENLAEGFRSIANYK